jgi:hypothetical protein
MEFLPSLSAVPAVWKQELGNQFPAFNTLCLQPEDWQVISYPCPAECGCWHRVVRRHDRSGAIGVCRCNPPNCPDLDLSITDITPLKVNRPKLARAICQALSLTSKFSEQAPSNTHQIGSWSADAVPVILTIQNEYDELRSVIAELGMRLHQKPFILLAPTTNLLTATSQELLADAHAGFFGLDSILTLSENGTLLPKRAPGEIFAAFSPASSLSISHSALCTPKYALRKSLGVWHLIFDGKQAYLRHERGLFYVAWLLYNPPEQPIHAIDLMAKIPEFYRKQLGLTSIADPVTGKAAPLLSGARIQERSLALDDRQTMRALFHKEKELEAILDSDDESEPVKAEALRELEQIAEFQRQHGRGSRDSARRAAHAVRSAIVRFHEHLHGAVGQDGGPHPVLRCFAEHINKHILIPSARYAGHGGPYARAGLAGCFTYERPGDVFWTG